MFNTARAIIKAGKIELLEEILLPEGTEVLVTPLREATDFFLLLSQPALDVVWDNAEDDVYAELLACPDFKALKGPHSIAGGIAPGQHA